MEHYNFDAFLREMAELNYSDIIIKAIEAGEAADKSATGGHRGVVQARKMGVPEYSQRIGSFIRFMQNGRRPDGVDDEEFRKYLVVVRPLVEKGQLKPSVLELFGEEEHD
ncbi:hypothetical protein ACFL5Z_16070 [Planctomycetota bacterium]